MQIWSDMNSLGSKGVLSTAPRNQILASFLNKTSHKIQPSNWWPSWGSRWALKIKSYYCDDVYCLVSFCLFHLILVCNYSCDLWAVLWSTLQASISPSLYEVWSFPLTALGSSGCLFSPPHLLQFCLFCGTSILAPVSWAEELAPFCSTLESIAPAPPPWLSFLSLPQIIHSEPHSIHPISITDVTIATLVE